MWGEQQATFEELGGTRSNKYENICFIGDGALKCRDILMGENRIFIEEWPTSEGAVNMATDRFEERKFENLALYEPIYLKQFIAGKAKDPFGLRQEMKK